MLVDLNQHLAMAILVSATGSADLEFGGVKGTIGVSKLVNGIGK
jgi:hypothetical protein